MLVTCSIGRTSHQSLILYTVARLDTRWRDNEDGNGLPVTSALRNRDGSTIEQGIYQLICGSARSIIKSILLPLKPANFAKGASLASHFQTNNPTQWTAAVLQLERQHPLVALCAEQWKAKHLLQAALRYKNRRVVVAAAAMMMTTWPKKTRVTTAEMVGNRISGLERYREGSQLRNGLG